MLSNRQDREGKGMEEGKKALAERRLTGSGNGAQKYSHQKKPCVKWPSTCLRGKTDGHLTKGSFTLLQLAHKSVTLGVKF